MKSKISRLTIILFAVWCLSIITVCFANDEPIPAPANSEKIGFGSAFGSGFGDSGQNVEARRQNVEARRRGELHVGDPRLAGVSASVRLTGGGRSRTSVMRVVRPNMDNLNNAYELRLKDNPGMQGRITVRWDIDEFGNVIRAKLVSSTVNDSIFELTVINKIRNWTFGRIEIPGDITEVEYPFVFTPD